MDKNNEILELESLCEILFSALCRAPQYHNDQCDNNARKQIRFAINFARKSKSMKRIKERIVGV